MAPEDRIKIFKVFNRFITFLLIITLIEGIFIRPILENNQFRSIISIVLLSICFLSLPFYNFSLRGWPRKEIAIEYWEAVKSGNRKYFLKRLLLVYGLYLFLFVIGLIYNYLKSRS